MWSFARFAALWVVTGFVGCAAPAPAIDDTDDDSELAGPDIVDPSDAEEDAAGAAGGSTEERDGSDDAELQSAEIIPLRATEDER